MTTYIPNTKAYIPLPHAQAYTPLPHAQAYIQQSYTSTINGKVVEDDAIRAIYNGKEAEVDIYDNGKIYHSKLNKKDIESIFSRKKHPLTLEKRLIKDFGLKGKKTRRHRNKNKNKKSKRMRSKRMRSKRMRSK